MEKFWNIIHYSIYKVLTKIYLSTTWIAEKYFETKFVKWIFKKNKRNSEIALKDLKFAYTDKRVGQSSFFAATVMISSVCYVFFGLHMYYFILFNNSYVPSAEVFIFPLFLYGILSGVINYYLLFRKDKYLKYFRKFEKESREWKIKWAWISFGVILASFMVFGSSIIVIMVGN